MSASREDYHSYRRLGLAGDIFNKSIIDELKGDSAIGHNRYSTTGENSIDNLQPLTVNGAVGWLGIAHNGNLVNAEELTQQLKKEGVIFQSTTDTEVIIHLMAKSGQPLVNALIYALERVKGAYSLLVLNQDYLVACRDRFGIRPLVMGDFNGSPVFSSETTSFDLIGATFVREVNPGEMIVVMLKDKKMVSLYPFDRGENKKCIFEYIYFSKPDSVVNGFNIHTVRNLLGQRLAQECPVANADVVIPIPDSGVPAAIGFAQWSKTPFEMGIVRNHYIGRTFLQPKQTMRDLGVKLKLNPVRNVVSGKRLVVVDDSLVRGTTSKKIIKLLREAGAKEIHLRISAPPTMFPCFFGIDTPTKDELIASSSSIEEIARHIGADSLGYLSKDGMVHVCEQFVGEGFCTACFSGDYPVDINNKRLSLKITNN
jgi:amidophosphoribosyltransferase